MSSAEQREPSRPPSGAPGDELAWLFSLQRFGIKPGLEATRRLLAAAGSPQTGMRVVLVAGTNGKGSVTSLLAACLQAAGRRTGSYFSPHLQRVGERVKVDGVEATDAELGRVLAALRPHAERLGATFFEVITVAALLHFREAGVDWVVMEVGLGGRFDATNALEPVLSLITGVGLDHQAVLGPDIATIATQKAGIIRPGVPLVTGATGVALDVIEERAVALGAPLLALGRELGVELLAHGWDGLEVELDLPVSLPPLHSSAAAESSAVVTVAGGAAKAHGTGEPERRGLRLSSPLVGRHQADNVALAAVAALCCGVSDAQVRAAVAATAWPGRLESLEYRGRRFVLDGAHNPQAAAALASSLNSLTPAPRVVILGLSADKDVAGICAAVAPLAPHLLVTRAVNSPRALDPHDLLTAASAAAPAAVVTALDDPAAALAESLELSSPGDVLVVAGSLFLVGEFRSLLRGEVPDGVQRWQ